MSFTINMLVHLNIGNAEGEFLNVWNVLLDQDSHNQIQLPFQTILTEDELITRVFPDVHIQHSNNTKWLCDRALLTPTNISVKEMNVRLLNMLPGEEKVYRQLIISVLRTKLSIILQISSIVLNQQELIHIIFY